MPLRRTLFYLQLEIYQISWVPFMKRARLLEDDGRGWKWNYDENYTVKSYYDIVTRKIAEKALKDHEIMLDSPSLRFNQPV